VSRLADVDNENDEYHVPVPVADVWAEYHRPACEEAGRKLTGRGAMRELRHPGCHLIMEPAQGQKRQGE
jgi:hypothetical protein